MTETQYRCHTGLDPVSRKNKTQYRHAEILLPEFIEGWYPESIKEKALDSSAEAGMTEIKEYLSLNPTQKKGEL